MKNICVPIVEREDNIEMDRKRIGCDGVDWFNWLSIGSSCGPVNTVMNLRGSINGRKVLDQLLRRVSTRVRERERMCVYTSPQRLNIRPMCMLFPNSHALSNTPIEI
jgi:hypothetical protein